MQAITQRTVSALKIKSRRDILILAGLPALLILYCLPERFFATTANGYSYCLHKQLLGIDCPGCGFTRATYYWLHMQFKYAISFNACVVFLYPVVLAEVSCLVMRREWLQKTRLIIYGCFCISLLLLYLFRICNP